MNQVLDLEIVTPERKILSIPVKDVVVPGIDGSFGVYPGHAPLLTSLGVGEISYDDETGKHYLAAANGYVEVLPQRVTILAQICESAREIDIERAREAKRRAEEILKQSTKVSDQDMLMAELSLKKALTRLMVAGRGRT